MADLPLLPASAAPQLRLLASRVRVRGTPGHVGEEPVWPRSPDRAFAARDSAGCLMGILVVTVDRRDGRTPRALTVVVDPGHRRRGVATALYGAAARAGVPVESISGASGLTPAGVAFRSARQQLGRA